jgi:glycopeptide antibiotics resistance protein
VRPFRHPSVIAVVLGFTVGLTIEVLQSYIPTRSSGTTDLIAKTFGTFLGVMLFRFTVFTASKTAPANCARSNAETGHHVGTGTTFPIPDSPGTC